jgi:hypothetical protein
MLKIGRGDSNAHKAAFRPPVRIHRAHRAHRAHRSLRQRVVSCV